MQQDENNFEEYELRFEVEVAFRHLIKTLILTTLRHTMPRGDWPAMMQDRSTYKFVQRNFKYVKQP